MKMKKLMISGIVLIVTMMIYITTIDKKIYYVALGDSLAIGQNPYGKVGYGYSDYVSNYLERNELLEFYTKDFAKSGYRTSDLYKDIENNKEIKSTNNKILSIKNALIKADILTLSIGANDLFYKIGMNDMEFNLDKKDEIYKYIDEVVKDIDKLLELVRKYCKEDIIMIGYYNPLSKISSHYTRELEPMFLYGNEQIRKIAYKHNAHYIDIYEIFMENPEYIPNPLDIHPSISGYEAIALQIINIIEKNIIN